ncbi:MAG: glycosyltransferase [Halieaceae bacterium]
MFEFVRRLFGIGEKAEEVNPTVNPARVEHRPLTPKLTNAPIPVHRFDPAVALPKGRQDMEKPLISFIVIVYKMPDQAEKTLLSLSTRYQRGVSEADYEVIVVENSSDAVLGEKRACQYGANVRYFYREETQPSPVPAVNFGASKACGNHVSIMVDGARMLSPAVVCYTLAALRIHSQIVVAIPGYHLGHTLQQRSILEGYCEEAEAQLLASVDWPADGYRLFEISCLSGTSGSGYFKPIGESNCLTVPTEIWRSLGGFDSAFTETGGGQVNLDFYKRAVELPDVQLVILMGEGSFHQFHGGITTGTKGKDRIKSMDDHFNQYAALRGEPYISPTKRPIYLGCIPDSAMKFMHHGTTQAIAALES